MKSTQASGSGSLQGTGAQYGPVFRRIFWAGTFSKVNDDRSTSYASRSDRLWVLIRMCASLSAMTCRHTRRMKFAIRRSSLTTNNTVTDKKYGTPLHSRSRRDVPCQT